MRCNRHLVLCFAFTCALLPKPYFLSLARTQAVFRPWLPPSSCWSHATPLVYFAPCSPTPVRTAALSTVYKFCHHGSQSISSCHLLLISSNFCARRFRLPKPVDRWINEPAPHYSAQPMYLFLLMRQLLDLIAKYWCSYCPSRVLCHVRCITCFTALCSDTPYASALCCIIGYSWFVDISASVSFGVAIASPKLLALWLA